MSGVTITLPLETAFALLAFVERAASEEVYGSFAGGDPRDFTPDPDCSTPEEREAHRVACEAWNNGCGIDLPASSRVEMMGNTMAFVTRAGFGLGGQVWRDPEATAIAAAFRKALEAGL